MGKSMELMANVKHFQVNTLPSSPESNSYYNLRLSNNRYRQYITDDNGEYIKQSDFFVDESVKVTANRDFVLSDNLLLLVNDSDNDITLKIVPGLPDNWIAFCENIGDGSINIQAKSLVYLKGDEDGFIEANSYLIRSSPGACYIRHNGNDEFIIIGNIE
jgi:hypothetical protein